MRKQLTIFDIQRPETPDTGTPVVGKTISSGKTVSGRFQRLSASGEWLVLDAGNKLRMLDRTTCTILESADETTCTILEGNDGA